MSESELRCPECGEKLHCGDRGNIYCTNIICDSKLKTWPHGYVVLCDQKRDIGGRNNEDTTCGCKERSRSE